MSHRSIQQYMSRERTYSTGQTQSLLQKKRKRKKLAKSKTWKGGFSKKRAFRWIENLKGRSRQKLGISFGIHHQEHTLLKVLFVWLGIDSCYRDLWFWVLFSTMLSPMKNDEW
jgi:hypothetical protein